MTGGRITLERGADSWIARLYGEQFAKAAEVFGEGAPIPTPYRLAAEADYVRDMISALNPGAVVEVLS